MSEISDYYFNEPDEIICGIKVPPITEEYRDDFPSVVDRFYTRYYKVRPETNDEDHLILFHSNRVCLIGLAPSHVALKKGIKSVEFNIGNCDRSHNHVTGKGKKGGMNLQPPSTLAILKCEDDSEYKILSCMTAKLIEVNERVVKNPKLLATEGDGYVAVVLPKPENCDAIKSSLLTQEQYDQLRQKC